MRRRLWILIHDGLAHPICAALWILGINRLGDWLHEVTVHPLNYDDERWSPPESP